VHGPCLGQSLGRGRDYPLAFADLPGLQNFLSGLAASAPARAAAVARVRGAQAGLLLHGISLQVPLELAEQRGPGLTGAPLDAQAADAIRREAANPLIAFALALTAVTGLAIEEVLDKKRAEPLSHSCEVYASGGGALDPPAHYTIPPAARPILAAAVFFQRQTCQPTSDLIAGVTVEQVHRAAQLAGIELPGPDKGAPPVWHTLARAWYVADPLHHGDVPGSGTHVAVL